MKGRKKRREDGGGRRGDKTEESEKGRKERWREVKDWRHGSEKKKGNVKNPSFFPSSFSLSNPPPTDLKV